MKQYSNSPHQPELLPPSVCATVTGLWGVGSYTLSQTPSLGVFATLGCVGAGAMTFKWAMRTLNTRDVFKAAKRQRDFLNEVADDRNQERFSTPAEINEGGLYADGGIFFGHHKGQDLYHDGEESTLVIAPPGKQKSTFILMSTVIAAALRVKSGKVKLTDAMRFVINDPSGELICVLRPILLAAGYRVESLCPHADELSADLNIALVDACMNIFATIDRDGDEFVIMEEVDRLVKLVAFEQDASSDQKVNFFLEEAQELLVAVVLYLLWRGETPTLKRVRQLVSGSPKELQSMFGDMAVSDAFDGELQALGKKFLGAMGATDQYQGLSGTCTQRLKIYKGRLGQHTSIDGFDPRTLKDDQPTALFITMPGKHTVVNAPWINTTISVLIEAVASDPRPKRVDFLIDEAGNMGGAIPNLLIAMARYRKQGFRATLFFQSLGQISHLYGENGLRQMVNYSGVIATFGIVEYESCKLFSDMAGKELYRDLSETLKDDPDNRLGSSLREQLLLTPQQIRTMPSDQVLIFAKNLKPIMATKVPYWSRRRWAKVAGKNPFYRKG